VAAWLRVLGIRRATCFELVLLVAYAAMLVVFSGFHEFWRDEVRALSMAAEASSPIDVIVRLKNDGHPGLWHLLLYTALAIYREPVVLRICATSVAIAAAWLVLFRSPFPRWQKALFLLGVFPAYEYSVMARNYGIGMLCLFAFAALYPRRHTHPLAFASPVFLLAHANVYCFFIACGIFGASLVEYWLRNSTVHRWNVSVTLPGPALGALLIIAIGCITSALTMMTDDKSIVFRPNDVSLGTVEQWSRAIVTPLRVFSEGLGFQELRQARHQDWATWFLWFVALTLLRRPYVFLMFLLGYTTMGFFASTIYVCVLRHQGAAFLLLFVGLWLVTARERLSPLPVEISRKWLTRAFRMLTSAGVTILLVAQLPNAYEKVRQDRDTELSSSKQFGRFIAANPRYQNAILIAEEDHFFEAIPYYSKVRLFLPRENRFGAYAEFTTVNQDALTLGDVLRQARHLARFYDEPVLLGFTFPITKPGPRRIEIGRRFFAYSAEEHGDFVASTKKLASIRASILTDEYFDLYELLGR
jgi:hypothetical protein